MIDSLYDKFKSWSDGGSVWLYSDPHFEDTNCKLMDPNWIEPFDQVAILNKYIHKGDTFVCLGDVGDPKYILMIKAKRKVLIAGNHDKVHMYRDVFDEIYDGPLFIADRILLSHEPIPGLPWCVNIHGHDHSGVEVFPEGCKHLNLAANVCGYKPVNLGKLIKDGLMSGIPNIHRVTINNATKRKETRKQSTEKLNRDNFFQKYCLLCGSQRCEGPGSEWFSGCEHKDKLFAIKTPKEIIKEIGYGDCYTTAEFAEYVRRGIFISYDGIGYYHDGQQKTNVPVSFIPEEIIENGKVYPYVCWYNK